MAENLASKYRPARFEDVSEQSVVVDIVKNICKTGKLSNRNFLFIGSAGCGKALPLDADILTPTGFIKMKDITAGQKVITRYGDVAEVTDIFPQGIRKMYKIELSDGSSLTVSDEHLNVVYRMRNGRKEDFVLETPELIDRLNEAGSGLTYAIDTYPIDTFNDPGRTYNLDPFLAGVFLLGGDVRPDDNFISFCLPANPTAGMKEHIERILSRDYNSHIDIIEETDDIVCYSVIQNGFKDSNSYQYSFGKATLLKQLIEDKLVFGRYDARIIPDKYLYASLRYRYEVIRGMLAATVSDDEYVSDVELTCSNKSESDSLAHLVRSCGIIDAISISTCCIDDPTCSWSHRLICSEDDKLAAWKDGFDKRTRLQRDVELDKYRRRYITSIQEVESQDCQCIYVDDPDHTFIANDFIPTHNTTIARIIAKELNGNLDECIEIDAASHSGVEAMRDIMNQAQTYPVGSNWKVFILDECFHKDSKVLTSTGYKKISEICPGDVVFTLSGTSKVLNRFENTVPSTHIALVHLNGKDILTTADHLFMTKYGWVPASQLKEGDIVYAESYQELRDMRETVREQCVRPSTSMREGMRRDTSQAKVESISTNLSTDWLHEIVSNLRETILHTQKREFTDLFERVWNYIEEAARPFGEATCCYAEAQTLIYMSRLWEEKMGQKLGAQEVLFEQMPGSLDASTIREPKISVLECLQNLWAEISSEISESADMLKEVRRFADRSCAEREKISGVFGSNEDQQSNVQSGYNPEDASDEREKWHIAFAACYAWWKWFLYTTTDAALSKFRPEVDIRISCEDRYQSKRQSNALSYQLQSRPRTSGHSIGSRSGWCRAPFEIAQIARSQERGVFDRVRVESVEIYQPGDNDKSFTSYFSDTELRSGHVTMYDLEVEGHPSYFVEDVLVHNCHAITPQGWQVALKTIESQPAKSIFIFATTNPEKIPDTIISRVQTFQLSKISLQGIYNRLKYIVDSENNEGAEINADADALLYIAKLSGGGMRDAITLLDKSLAYSKNVTLDNLEKALGLPNYDDYFELLGAITKKDNQSIVNIINKVYNSGVNFTRWFDGFYGFVTNIVKYIYLQDINQTMIPSTYLDRIKGYGPAHSAVCLKLSNKLIEMNRELKTSQYLQEVAISYLCTPPALKGGN